MSAGDLKRLTNIVVALHVHKAMDEMTRMVRMMPLRMRERYATATMGRRQYPRMEVEVARSMSWDIKLRRSQMLPQPIIPRPYMKPNWALPLSNRANPKQSKNTSGPEGLDWLKNQYQNKK
jgi:hypothetical protein